MDLVGGWVSTHLKHMRSRQIGLFLQGLGWKLKKHHWISPFRVLEPATFSFDKSTKASVETMLWRKEYSLGKLNYCNLWILKTSKKRVGSFLRWLGAPGSDRYGHGVTWVAAESPRKTGPKKINWVSLGSQLQPYVYRSYIYIYGCFQK